ncbi:MAG: hypothetical protein HYZ58_13545 [Acidobacteria bacterium]|nr:hypothetical protein [Acidobacteriota bacterium]
MAATQTAEVNQATRERRASPRHHVALGGRISWRDRAGAVQTASVITQDVSEGGAFIEIIDRPRAIPLYRLVNLQLDPRSFDGRQLPAVLRQELLTLVVRAVSIDGKSEFRVPPRYVLRLLVDPRRGAAPGVHPSVARRVA